MHSRKSYRNKQKHSSKHIKYLSEKGQYLVLQMYVAEMHFSSLFSCLWYKSAQLLEFFNFFPFSSAKLYMKAFTIFNSFYNVQASCKAKNPCKNCCTNISKNEIIIHAATSVWTIFNSKKCEKIDSEEFRISVDSKYLLIILSNDEWILCFRLAPVRLLIISYED